MARSPRFNFRWVLMALWVQAALVLFADDAKVKTAADHRFNLSFDGGTVSQLVARVHRLLADAKVERPLNINVMPEQASTPIPPLTLQSVTFRELARFLHDFSGHRARSSTQAGRAAQTYGFEESAGIWYFTVATHEGVGRVQKIPVTDQAAIYRVKIKPGVDVLATMRKAFRDAGRRVPEQMSWHPQNQVLVLRAQTDDHEVLKSALNLLKDAPARRRLLVPASAAD
jgi:hypothetical protein